MSFTSSGSLASPIEQQIFVEEQKYQQHFKADHEFEVLKKIRMKINSLKEELSKQRTENTKSFGDNSNNKHPFSN